MAGRPRLAPRAGPQTTADRMLAPITSLAPLVSPELAEEILTAPAPNWPQRFECLWEPVGGGPFYEATAETARRPLRFDGRWIEDPRSITLRIEGSPERQANDWRGFRVRLSGHALDRAAVVLADLPGSNIIALGGDGTWIVLWIRHVDVFHDNVATAYGYADWAVEKPEYQIVQIGSTPPTADEEKLIRRGYRVLRRFPTTMTLRGKPGSGTPEERRRADARERLTKAGHEILHDPVPSPISARYLSTALRVSIRAVYLALETADWEIGDVQEAANSLHMGCRNAG
jgi:hypothetical protein